LRPRGRHRRLSPLTKTNYAENPRLEETDAQGDEEDPDTSQMNLPMTTFPLPVTAQWQRIAKISISRRKDDPDDDWLQGHVPGVHGLLPAKKGESVTRIIPTSLLFWLPVEKAFVYILTHTIY